MAMYIKWCGEQGHRPFPLNAEAVHQYLRYCNGRAHTRGQAFLEAAAFLCHYFRVPTGEALDPQASGIAFQGLEAKPPPNKRREVPKSIVAAWEQKAVLAARRGTPLARHVVRGFLLCPLHARRRRRAIPPLRRSRVRAFHVVHAAPVRRGRDVLEAKGCALPTQYIMARN